MTYPYPHLNRPSVQWQKQETSAPRVSDWIKTVDQLEDLADVDIAILGVPLSRSSISASGASETPQAIRLAWKSFQPYQIEYDADLTSLKVVDLGDVKQHFTDISLSHQYICDAMVQMRKLHPWTLPISIGGDHSITAMLIKGWKSVHPDQRIGILQLDTHFDLRSLEDHGATNGTPIRNLIESGTTQGSDVWNIGLHGFFNAKELKEYAEKHGVNYVPLSRAREKGISKTIQTALDDLKKRVDMIYLTVDMDVLDIGCAPGTPAGAPGGMRTEELLEAVYTAASEDLVQAMDIVCLDPLRDIREITVKAGVSVMLQFMTGFLQRKNLVEKE